MSVDRTDGQVRARMSDLSVQVRLLASLSCPDQQAIQISHNISQMIIENPQIRGELIDAGIVPTALRKFDESEDYKLRVTFGALMNALVSQHASKADSQIQVSIGRARRELRELGALFVILRVLRLIDKHDQYLWTILSDTMVVILHHMDCASLTFNELAVPWLVSQLELSWAPWQVFSCASLLRSCLGIKEAADPADSILSHALSSGCLNVLIAKLAVCCGQDGNQPIASSIDALIRLPHAGLVALGLNAIPAILANIASPQSNPSSFIEPHSEWSDELQYHRNLVRILNKIVSAQCQNASFCAECQSIQLQGTATLLRSNCIPLIVDRLWCKVSSKLLLNMGITVEMASSQHSYVINPDECEQFFHVCAQELMNKMASVSSMVVQPHSVQDINMCKISPLAVANALENLSRLSGGVKAILERSGGVVVVVKLLNSTLQNELKLDTSMALPHPRMGMGMYTVHKNGASSLTSLLSTLLHLVRKRRGTKGAVAAGVLRSIIPALFVASVSDDLDEDQQRTHQTLKDPHVHAIAAEILARISSITKGQRQAITVAATILKALCVHAAEFPVITLPLLNVLGFIASTQDGLCNLAYCKAAIALQYVRELMVKKQQSHHDFTVLDNQEQLEVAEKLEALQRLIKLQQVRISIFFARVSGSCACAASRRLVWPEDAHQAEFQAASASKLCPFAKATNTQGLNFPGVCKVIMSVLSCGAFMGELIQRIGTDQDVFFRKTILQYCVSQKLDQWQNMRLIQEELGSTFAEESAGIQKWIKIHELTCTAAHMIEKILKEQTTAQPMRQQPQSLGLGQMPMNMVAAHLKDCITLPMNCDAFVLARSAVSVFSPPLAMLGIGDGVSELVVLCQDPPFSRHSLPHGWTEMTDPASGHCYFVNQAQGLTQWERPIQTLPSLLSPPTNRTWSYEPCVYHPFKSKTHAIQNVQIQQRAWSFDAQTIPKTKSGGKESAASSDGDESLGLMNIIWAELLKAAHETESEEL